MKLNITIQGEVELDPEDFREEADVVDGTDVTLEDIKKVLEDCNGSIGDIELSVERVTLEEVKP